MTEERTTISVTRETYEALKNLGRTGDSFDHVLRRLLNLDKVTA